MDFEIHQFMENASYLKEKIIYVTKYTAFISTEDANIQIDVYDCETETCDLSMKVSDSRANEIIASFMNDASVKDVIFFDDEDI